jgi:hypothetical protein
MAEPRWQRHCRAVEAQQLEHGGDSEKHDHSLVHTTQTPTYAELLRRCRFKTARTACTSHCRPQDAQSWECAQRRGRSLRRRQTETTVEMAGGAGGKVESE